MLGLQMIVLARYPVRPLSKAWLNFKLLLGPGWLCYASELFGPVPCLCAGAKFRCVSLNAGVLWWKASFILHAVVAVRSSPQRLLPTWFPGPSPLTHLSTQQYPSVTSLAESRKAQRSSV